MNIRLQNIPSAEALSGLLAADYPKHTCKNGVILVKHETEKYLIKHIDYDNFTVELLISSTYNIIGLVAGLFLSRLLVSGASELWLRVLVSSLLVFAALFSVKKLYMNVYREKPKFFLKYLESLTENQGAEPAEKPE